MLGKSVVGKCEVQRGHFGVTSDFCQNRRCADFCHPAVAFHHRLEGIGSDGQRLPSIRTNSGTMLRPATARCIASIVACRIFSSSISCGSARPRLQHSAFSLISSNSARRRFSLSFWNHSDPQSASPDRGSPPRSPPRQPGATPDLIDAGNQMGMRIDELHHCFANSSTASAACSSALQRIC